MIRPQEKIIARRAAIYAVSVHIILIVVMIVSFEWRVKLPQVAEVELWDSIPQPSAKAVDATVRGFGDMVRVFPAATSVPRGERVIESAFYGRDCKNNVSK